MGLTPYSLCSTSDHLAFRVLNLYPILLHIQYWHSKEKTSEFKFVKQELWWSTVILRNLAVMKIIGPEALESARLKKHNLCFCLQTSTSARRTWTSVAMASASTPLAGTAVNVTWASCPVLTGKPVKVSNHGEAVRSLRGWMRFTYSNMTGFFFFLF